ncbi:MAG: glycosyltransferase [Reyranella sp.]|uniref:glycosyltransferase n=1 Tax=Reyranella sp. TaxID=1929291 RepID=UPI00272F2CBE|nr:glycosyltransferase [Reyranella sp.]MDP1966339.1 glycosyltransferase [Reyranella sp.]MDP2372362.1 glycosyltransferase [Reyranella sp.]
MPALQFPRLNALFLSRRWSRGQLQGSFPPATALDPLGTAIAKGLAAGNAKRRPTQEIRKAARAIRDHARATGGREAAILELETFVSDYPAVEEFQKIVARLLHEMHDERALGAWLGISLRFPASMDAFHNLALLTQRAKGSDALRTILQARFPRMPRRLDQLLAYAEACDAAGETLKRRAAFDRLARIFAKRNDSWLLATSWLEEEWGINRSAGTILRRLAAGTGLGAPILRDSQRLQTVVGAWEQSESRAVDQGSLASVKVLGALFDRVLEARQSAALLPSRDTGSLLLLTGSLGTGGAERQLVTTAIGLSQMSLEQRTLQDGLILDPVNVMARSLRDRKDGAFFLSNLQQAGVSVRSYRELPDFAGDLATSAVRPALSALGFLPWSTAEAVIKLTDQLRLMKPEVVHIWQDGLVYAAGLAALLAGVPRIILSGRSTPPPDRRENYLVEYDIIYRSLLREPGVKLSVNSRYAANRYAAWLNMDPERIAVIPNGVARAPNTADPGAETAFREFEQRTGPSSLTLGAVMRLDEVKRPLLWVDAAASILGRIPDARFTIVGDGPLRARAEKRAEALGISGRCLFVGRSTCVGYWLSKMDALMLLSEHEGLPNALIEAQLAGVPVITSAAGGAPEAVVPGKTGIVTSLNPTPGNMADLFTALMAEPGRLKQMGIEAEQWAKVAFPIGRMLSSTLQTYADAGHSEPLVDGTGLANSVPGGLAPGYRITN